MAIYDENAIITTATTYFNNAKRYIRKRDMEIYHRTKALSKSDMDLEDISMDFYKKPYSLVPFAFYVI